MYAHDGILQKKLYRGAVFEFRHFKESGSYDGTDLCCFVPVEEGL